MKWYDKNRYKMLDLSTINGYVYIPAKEYVEQNPQESDVEDFRQNGDRIELIIGGAVFVFRGDVAKELWELLQTTDSSQLLKG
jgi:hypothetical protein